MQLRKLSVISMKERAIVQYGACHCSERADWKCGTIEVHWSLWQKKHRANFSTYLVRFLWCRKCRVQGWISAASLRLPSTLNESNAMYPLKSYIECRRSALEWCFDCRFAGLLPTLAPPSRSLTGSAPETVVPTPRDFVSASEWNSWGEYAIPRVSCCLRSMSRPLRHAALSRSLVRYSDFWMTKWCWCQWPPPRRLHWWH